MAGAGSLSGVVIRREDYVAMRRHVAREAPVEACGLVAGRKGRSLKVYPIPNVLRSAVGFRMAPEAQWRAMREMLERGWDMLAIYHSHPQGPPYPSTTDLREMAYPRATYLIWAPVGEVWLCRAFVLGAEGFVEIPLRQG